MGLFDFLKSSGKESHRGVLETVPNLPPGRLGAALREIYLCTHSVEIHLAIRQIGGVLIDDGREPDWNKLSVLWDQVIDIREKKRRR